MNHQVVGFGLFATGPAQAQLVAVAAGEVAAVAEAARVKAVSTFFFHGSDGGRLLCAYTRQRLTKQTASCVAPKQRLARRPGV